MFPIKTRKKSIPVEWPLYKKVVSTYLDIYFNEFYYINRPKYFPLSGKLKMAKGKGFFRNNKTQLHHMSRSIVWIWYERPSFAYFANIRILKLKGSTSRVGKLDRNFKTDNDVELLQTHHKVLQELKYNDKFFKL
jgi:hypothetical protein